MTGESDIEKLLKYMSPKLCSEEYVFCTIKNACYGDYADAKPLASFLEKEGLSLVLARKSADKYDMSYEGIFKCITLEVHSDLQAVGLTAAVSGRLCENNISANVIAGFFHDHIFVPAESAEKALNVLSAFSVQS